MNDVVRRQLEGLYGPLHAGEYKIGDRISWAGGTGEIIWIAGPGYSATGKAHGVTYIVQEHEGDFPTPIHASEVTQVP